MAEQTGLCLIFSETPKTGFSRQGPYYSKTCVKGPLSKRPKIGFQDQLSLNAGQKYCRMLQGEHSAILSTFIKLPFVIKIFVLSIFEWLFYTDFTVSYMGEDKRKPDCVTCEQQSCRSACSMQFDQHLYYSLSGKYKS